MTTLDSAPGAAQDAPIEWFDALAHTVTADGDWPRCAECGDYGSHEDCQPEAVAERAPEQAAASVARAEVDADVSTPVGVGSDGSISAPMVAALESAWAAIRVRHPEVPAVVIVLGGGSDGRPGTLKLGHFAALRWRTTPACDTTDDAAEDTDESDGTNRTAGQGEAQPLGEVFVGGEGLARGPVDVLGTLLHEAAHALADVRGVKDTSRQGRWHNARFKALAEELGVEVTKDPKLGWSPTTVTNQAREDYAATVDELASALRMKRAIDGIGFGLGTSGDNGDNGGDPDGEGDESGKRKTTPACVCGCGRRIRVAPTVLALGPIVCGVCEQPFIPDIPDIPDTHGDQPDVDGSGDEDEGDDLDDVRAAS